MGPFCVTRSNPTHQLTDPTRPNQIQLLSVNLLSAEFADEILVLLL